MSITRAPASSNAGIVLENVSFSYGERPVLAGVSLEIARGEVWALVGRSGCGKTTLIHIVAGLFRPTAGRVRVAGREAMEVGRIRGVVFQEDSLLGWLSVKENVLFPRHRDADGERRQSGEDMLRAVGLAEYCSSSPAELSTGMRKRLEFARALLADQEYILADEPFGTVDALTRRDLWGLWMKLRSRNPRTGILATHDPEEAIRLCDAVVTLRTGNPGGVACVFRIPPGVRALGVPAEDLRFWELKEQLINSL